MKTEYHALLAIVRAVLRGENVTPELLRDVDVSHLCALAKQHYLIGFLYRGCYTIDLPLSVRGDIERAYFAAYAQQTEQESFAEELLAHLRTAGVRHMPLKGYWMRRLYPSPDLRMSCDLDVFYDASYRDGIQAFCREAGFTRGEGSPHNDVFYRGTLSFESHHSLTEHTAHEREYYRDVWDRLHTEDGLLYHFSHEDFYFYMLLHMRKHFYEGNIGVRALLDIHVYQHTYPSLDRGYLDGLFAEFEMRGFVDKMEKLARVWFAEDTTDDDMAFLGDFIMEGGISGTTEQKARMNAVDEKPIGRFRYFMRRLFPPYAEMARAHPTLRRCPLFLPFFWIGRLFARLFSGKARRAYKVESAALDKENLERVARIKKMMEE